MQPTFNCFFMPIASPQYPQACYYALQNQAFQLDPVDFPEYFQEKPQTITELEC
jgi:hypothetical protein